MTKFVRNLPLNIGFLLALAPAFLLSPEKQRVLLPRSVIDLLYPYSLTHWEVLVLKANPSDYAKQFVVLSAFAVIVGGFSIFLKLYFYYKNSDLASLSTRHKASYVAYPGRFLFVALGFNFMLLVARFAYIKSMTDIVTNGNHLLPTEKAVYPIIATLGPEFLVVSSFTLGFAVIAACFRAFLWVREGY